MDIGRHRVHQSLDPCFVRIFLVSQGRILNACRSISIAGLVCLGGHTPVADPGLNFRDVFSGTTSDGNGLANALVKITFAYAGFTNGFNMMNEVKVGH